MGIGSRKIQKGDISKSTKANCIMKSNSSTFEGISGEWQNFIGESELEGKGWKSAKALASVFQTINQTFQMLSEQVSEANQKVITSQGILKNDQIDEQALKQRIEQNKQTMSQLSQAQTLWKRDNPDKSSSSFDNLNRSIGNENAVLQKEIDSLDTFDSATRSVYNDLEGTISKVKSLLSQVSKSSSVYDSKTGLFTTKHIDKKAVAKLNKTLDKYNESQTQKAIKFINDLYKKNPAAAIAKIQGDEKLFRYLMAGVSKCPKDVQNAVFGVFALKKNLDDLPQKSVEALLKSPKFAKFLNSQKPEVQLTMLTQLDRLGKKGWSVLAPMGYLASVLSKTSSGAKAIEAAKIGFKQFQKLDKISKFIKANPELKKALGYAGDGASVGAYSYDEYINPDSPAYGNVSMSVYGGINSFLWSAGPIEGVDYGGPVGGIAGTINYFAQGGGLSDIPILNKIPIIKHIDDWHTFATEKDKRKWLDEQYKQYGKHTVTPGDETYRPGVQPASGSTNFDPGTVNKEPSSGFVNPNQSPIQNWGIK